MSVKSISKVLAGEQDIEFGSGQATQTRGGVSVDINRLNIAKTVTSISIFANDDTATDYIDPTKFTIVNVVGYSSNNDGGEGMFFWDSVANISGADDGTAFISGVSPTIGLWRRLGTNTENVNVKWWGAKGDGSTDDTVSVGKALTYANAELKSVLYFPKGTYNLTSTLDLSASTAVSIKGDGRQLTFLNYIGAVTPGIKIDTGDEVHKNAQYAMLRDFTMLTDNLTSVGILLISTMSLTDVVHAALIKDVLFVGDSTSTSWHKCIHSQDVRGITVKHCLALGKTGGSAGNTFWHIDNVLALSTDFYTFFDVEANDYATETSGLTPTGGNIQANLLDGSVTNAKVADDTLLFVKTNTAAIADQAAAEAGTADDKFMTPERVKQAIFNYPAEVQEVYSETVVFATGSNVMIEDDTIPQITDGFEVLTGSITPTKATNKIIVEGLFHVSVAAGERLLWGLFTDANADAYCSGGTGILNNAYIYTFPFYGEFIAGDIIATTLRLRLGPVSAATVATINGIGGARQLGGSLKTHMRITEIEV